MVSAKPPGFVQNGVQIGPGATALTRIFGAFGARQAFGQRQHRGLGRAE